jgi:hypothetical protein
MNKRVYKFTKAEHAISSIQEKRLKISTLDDLNDPFDLCPVDITHPAIAKAIDNHLAHFRQTAGIICFSRNWDNLLLWSHYGDSHAGVCLGIDIADPLGIDADVLYQPNVLQIRGREDVTPDLIDRLLRTKHESWSYEQEVRLLVCLRDPPDKNGRRWMKFGAPLRLKEVIIGVNCPPDDSRRVEEAVKCYGGGVECTWAGMRPDAFLLVKQDRPPWWHSTIHENPTPLNEGASPPETENPPRVGGGSVNA